MSHYYTTHYSDLISEVNRLVEMGQFDEAITKLITVPSVCVESYNDAQNRSVEIYHKKMNALAAQQKAKTDKEGLVLIQQAKAAWSSKQDYESASNAFLNRRTANVSAPAPNHIGQYVSSRFTPIPTSNANGK